MATRDAGEGTGVGRELAAESGAGLGPREAAGNGGEDGDEDDNALLCSRVSALVEATRHQIMATTETLFIIV